MNEISDLPFSPTFCTIMSTVILRSASREKISRLVPGTSGTPTTVIRASSRRHGRTADRLVRPLRLRARSSCPAMSLKLLRTWIGTEYFLANSIERLCITPAPRLASSSISS